MQKRFSTRQPEGIAPEGHKGFDPLIPLIHGQKTSGLLAIGAAIEASQITASCQRETHDPQGTPSPITWVFIIIVPFNICVSVGKPSIELPSVLPFG